MINGVVHLYVVHMMTEPEVINMIEGVVVDNEGDKEVEGDDEVEKELDDEVNGQKETDKEDVHDFDAEVEKELDDDEVNGEKETDKEDVHEVHAEVEENLHEADEVEVVEVYDETEDKSDADGEDTRTDVAAEQFCDEGLVDVSVEADEEVEPWDGHVECEVGGTREDIGGAGSSSQPQCSNSSEDEVGGVGSGDEFSDIEWHSDEFLTATDIDEEDNDEESYGSFPTFSMPKSMDQYKWEVGTYFTEKKEFTEAI